MERADKKAAENQESSKHAEGNDKNKLFDSVRDEIAGASTASLQKPFTVSDEMKKAMSDVSKLLPPICIFVPQAPLDPAALKMERDNPEKGRE